MLFCCQGEVFAYVVPNLYSDFKRLMLTAYRKVDKAFTTQTKI